MAPSSEATLPLTRRVRKSIGANTDLSRAMDKENATVDLGIAMGANRKKLRSKSIGPGGLDALRQGQGNRRASLAIPPKPRSILKPTISALPEIPPLKPKQSLQSKTLEAARGSSGSSDELGGFKIALRTEEEQQAAAREREERERRDARRKSLANRRVSFAAEATLHTFHEVEYMQDSKNAKKGQPANKPQGSQGYPDSQEESKPASRRRSSLASMFQNPPQDDTVASTAYSSDSEPADAVEEIAADEEEEEEIDSNSNSDSDDGTMMSIETEEVTGTSIGSDRSVDSDDGSSTLDEALRMAARQAGTQRLDEDSDDGEEIIPSFGWAKKSNQPSAPPPVQQKSTTEDENVEDQNDEDSEMDMDMGMDADADMEMTRPMGRIIKPSLTNDEPDQEPEMSMDVTRAFGGILTQDTKSEPAPDLDDEDDDEAMEEATMEFTTAIGGIHRNKTEELDEVDNVNEDMSMEFTSVMGGLLSRNTNKLPMNRRSMAGTEDMTMDMTVGLGKIVSSRHQTQEQEGEQEEDAEEDDGVTGMDITSGMDMTTALGGIIKNAIAATKGFFTDDPLEAPSSPVVLQPSPVRRPVVTTNPKSASPDSLLNENPLPQDAGPQPLGGLNDPTRTPSPIVPVTPQRGSVLSKRKSPGSRTRTPQSNSRPVTRSISSRTPSPVKPAQSRTRRSLFENEVVVKSNTPPSLLTPQKRQLSGIGADRNGLGSPQVTAILDQRPSLNDSAQKFVPGKRAVAFENPQEQVVQLNQERLEEAERLSQRLANGSQEDKDATLNLREMIKSLSPKRQPLRGRKSLHVGSARGLLGKRPAELDDEDANAENDSIKRLKSRQESPVKSVRLPQPPSKAETIGRAMKRLSLPGKSQQESFSSPLKNPSTPRKHGVFKDAAASQTIHDISIHESPPNQNETPDDNSEGRMHLQDFLNLTSIRFMELTTTKRRHTIAPTNQLHNNAFADGVDDQSLERCVVAGACTLPTLELYQHSCRELKKYISEGRRIVKEIETDTFEENPALFKEYITATPEVKALMDNQFKNVKTHARHLSKAMWYEWRMKLQDGLREGLLGIAEGMKSDEAILKEQETLLASVMPSITARYESLLEESNTLEDVAKELADCDPEELQSAREELVSLDEDIAQKKKMIAQLRREFEEAEGDVNELASYKETCLEDVREAELIREECRGWSSSEVNNHKARVDSIEKQHGWTVTGISGSTLSMSYKREIELVFNIASFQQQKDTNSPIDLWYIADAREKDPLPKTIEKEFFLQCIRDHIRALPQNKTKVTHLLEIVKTAWDRANFVSRQIDRVNVTFPTRVHKTSDSSIAITSSLLVVPLETRVEATLNLQGFSGLDGVEVDVTPEARVVYGEQFNVGKLGEFLATRVGKKIGAGEEEWSNIVLKLHDRLIARGRN